MLHVVGAAITDAGRVLAARRRRLPALWEFPGGKVEAGETPRDALVRECTEELGVRVEPVAALAAAADERIRLEIWHARLLAGRPTPHADHDEVTWLAADELAQVSWLPLDVAVLPAVHRLLTDNRCG